MKNFLVSKFPTFAILLMICSNVYAGGLMVTPSRLEFKNDVVNQEVKLVNKSDKTVTYRILLQHLRMNENGEYREILDSETNVQEKFADELLRFSPRKITLKPGEVQTVRLMLKKNNDAANGEYRSHLLMREEPSADFNQSNNVEISAKEDDKKISIILKPLFGISIPVIITKGNLVAQSSINNLFLKSDEQDKDKKILSFTVNRTGEASLFGNILVCFKPNKSGQSYDVGMLNSIAVFSPYEKRNVNIKLDLPKNIKLSDGVMEVKFVARSEDSNKDKEQVFAKGSLLVK